MRSAPNEIHSSEVAVNDFAAQTPQRNAII